MTFLTGRGEGPSFPYAGQPMHVLAGDSEQPAGFAAAEIAIPAGFPGPVPHAHDAFDEAIYVLEGRLLVWGDGEPVEAVPGSMLTAPRGQRHGFSNPLRLPRPGAGHLGAFRARAGVHAGRGRRPAAGHATGPGGHARRVRQARQPAAALARVKFGKNGAKVRIWPVFRDDHTLSVS